MRHPRRSGYSLIEVLACIALMAALIPTASKLYVSITRLHAAQESALDRVLAFDNLEHDLRAAAAQASGVANSVGAFTTAERTVVLRMGTGYTVFSVDQDFQPYRVELTPAQGGWEQAATRYRVPRVRCRFVVYGDGVGVEFFGRPISPVDRQGNKPAVVHMLAALRSTEGRP